jgi:hypothetical protein
MRRVRFPAADRQLRRARGQTGAEKPPDLTDRSRGSLNAVDSQAQTAGPDGADSRTGGRGPEVEAA